MNTTFGSTCHGAGRVLSRTQALKLKSGKEAVSDLFKKGILVRTADIKNLPEEIPEAYKDIDEVISVVSGAGISEKIARMRPLAGI